MEIVQIKIDDLIPWEENPRQMTTEQVDALKESITRFGIVDPIIVNQHPDRMNMIVGGHQRVKIAKMLGMTELPCVIVNLDAEKEKELNLRLNRNLGEWNWDMLAGFEKDFLLNVGFDKLELQKGFDLRIPINEDDAPEPPQEPKTKLGDLYILGNHRLLCGDATKKEDVERLINGQKADMVYCDPPYGMNLDTDWTSLRGGLNAIVQTKGGKYNPIIGDDQQFDPTFLLTAFDDVDEIFLWGGDYYSKLLPDGGSWIVWDKRKPNGQERAIGSAFELLWTKQRHKREILRHDWFGFLSSENISEARNRVHPTQKPTSLHREVFEKWLKGDLVVDLFGGSGSTLIACEQLNRKCYMMEIDPCYCDVIIQRWEKLTGQHATLA